MNDMSRGPSPHFSVERISRSTGAKAVARAAYRHSTRMEAEATGPTENFGANVGELKHSEIMLAADAPAWAAKAYGQQAFRAAMEELLAEPLHRPEPPEPMAWARLSERLWNDIEHAETCLNRQPGRAHLAWAITAVLPRVLSEGGRIRLLRDYVAEAFRDHRTAVDCVIRDKGDGNPHAFLALPTRPLGAEDWGGKHRKLRGPGWIRALRQAWQRHVNLALEREGTARADRHAIPRGPGPPARIRKLRPEDRGQRREGGRHVPREAPLGGKQPAEPVASSGRPQAHPCRRPGALLVLHVAGTARRAVGPPRRDAGHASGGPGRKARRFPGPGAERKDRPGRGAPLRHPGKSPTGTRARRAASTKENDMTLTDETNKSGTSGGGTERIEHLEARALSLGIELHAAATTGDVEQIAALVEHGAKPDARAPDGSTPMHTAARHGQSAAVAALVEVGADPDLRTTTAPRPCTSRPARATPPRSSSSQGSAPTRRRRTPWDARRSTGCPPTFPTASARCAGRQETSPRPPRRSSATRTTLPREPGTTPPKAETTKRRRT